jgi:ABC-2 type transport system permease protein
MLPLIFVLPLVQLIILVNAATMDMQNIRITVVDHDLSSHSRLIVQKLEASPFFELDDLALNRDQAMDRLMNGVTDVVLILPAEMEKHLVKRGKTTVQLLPDAINAQKAQLAYAYLNGLLADVSINVFMENGRTMDLKKVEVVSSYWFNPELNYKFFMLPGILVILVTIIGLFLSALNLVREKEIGTAEQINVTPILKYQFIIGKLVPFWIIGMVELALGLLIGKLLYNIPINGSLLVLFSFSAIYLLAVLGFGLLISSITNTQQQVMFLSFFFILIFVLMSGVFTSVENMPMWGQYFNYINPLYYFMNVTRMVLLKGAGFAAIAIEMIAISIYATVMLPLAVFSYRKTQ